MEETDPVLTRMDLLLQAWEATLDRRRIFLSCYRMMTANILAAIAAREFEDPEWVAKLMESFAILYFDALQAYENDPALSPVPWRITFKAAGSPRTGALQNLVLGVNAHINYDLVFALSGMLAPEWPGLSDEQRQRRYRDHCRVNAVIHATIKAVQDQVIDPLEPVLGVMDKLLGPLDEWMTTLLISDWREEVWRHAVQMLDPLLQPERPAVLSRVERTARDRAEDILGKGTLEDWVEFV